jgi:VWFA-related protein
MKSLTVSVLLLCLLGVLAAQAPAPQTQSIPEDNPQSRIVVDVSPVSVLFTVTDRRGRFVTGLKQSDFEVREGNVKQAIRSFAAESDLPLRLAILVDSSNSIRGRFQFIQEAAIEFINDAMRQGVDRAMLVSFDSAAEVQEPLTNDTSKLANTIRNLRAGGGTCLYDAIVVASRDHFMKDQPRAGFRHAIVILSDGEDNSSRYSRDQALEYAQMADAVIYTISTNAVIGTRQDSPGDKVLRLLSRETGGLTFFPFKAEDLAQSFENIANELRHQYSILYRPENLKTDGSFVPIEIRVPTQDNLKVRARSGYYAVPPSASR